MWTAVLTIGTPLGHGTTSPSTAAAAHSASDYLLLLGTLASGPQVGAQTLDTGASRQDNEQSIIHLAKQNGIQLFMIINKGLKELQLKGGQG